MKNTRNFIFLVSALVLFSCKQTPTSISSSHAIENGISFSWNEQWNGYFAFASSERLSGEVYVPSNYLGKPVVGLRERAFYACQNITKISLPSSMKVIERKAFPFDARQLELYFSVESMTDWLNVNGKENLVGEVHLQQGQEAEIVDVKIPQGEKEIRDFAFYCCSSVRSIDISETVERIGDYAFAYCNALEEISLPDSVVSIGDYAFTSLEPSLYTTYDNALYLGNKTHPYRWLMKAKNQDISSCKIADGCKYLYSGSFAFCQGLSEIAVPLSVEAIGHDAFAYDSSLARLTLSEGVKTIGDRSFSHCEALTEIQIPSSVETLGKESFACCREIQLLSLGDGVKVVGEGAFADCVKISSLTLPRSLCALREHAFSGCRNLKEVSIAQENPNFASLGGVLYDKSMQSLVYFPAALAEEYVLPDSLIDVPFDAFDECVALTSFAVGQANEAFSSYDGVLYDKERASLIRCPRGKQADVEWPSSLRRIGGHAFYHCTLPSLLILPNSIESIGERAFAETGYAQKIVFGANVKEIEDFAFAGMPLDIMVLFEGTQEQWDAIASGWSHSSWIQDFARYFFSEKEPAQAGNYWHYADGIPTLW